MSDTCIVCLGDLGGNVNDSPAAAAADPAPRLDLNVEHSSTETCHKAYGVESGEDSDHIAHLLPCGHILHNNCLKPWAERANSCPICRRPFNAVELSARPGGTIISSYAVEDRVQVADIEPSMIIEYVDSDDLTDYQPCVICGDSNNEELLLLCDGCDIPTHTYCLGLDDVPPESWYCDRCEVQRTMMLASEPPAPPRRRRHRTRALQMRQQSRNQLSAFHWARVWQSVRNHLDLDLDFPFDDEIAYPRRLRRHPWEDSRQQTRVGRDRAGTPPCYLDLEAPRPSRPRPPRVPTPEPESLEEVRAWNAFERAREIENNPRAAWKRKEPSPSPAPSEPERKLKRPRTRRPEELAAMAVRNRGSAMAVGSQVSARTNAGRPTEPSFLQSLLKEVEEGRSTLQAACSQTSNVLTGHSASDLSSPSISPGPSNHSSPRFPARSSSSDRRSISPMRLASPTAYSSPPFSPEVSSPASYGDCQTTGLGFRRTPRTSSRSPVIQTDDTSPTRPGLPLTVKSEIQRLVGSALKPHYRDRGVSKDEYTKINRTISRKLYDRVGNIKTLEADLKADLEKTARGEVKSAIETLRRGKVAGDSDGAGNS